MVGAAVTILRVGAVAALVGQACGSPRPVAPTSPDLEILPLDAGSEARTPTTDGVRFGHPAPSPGATWSVAVRASSRSEDPLGGEQISTYESEYTVEIVAVDGPAPSRVRLRFARNVLSFQGQAKPTVIDGKEYLVDARAPHVRDKAGGAAPEAEAQRVLDVFPDLGTRTRIDEVLPDEAMRIGERRDELAAAVLRVIHPRAWTLRVGSALLAEALGDHARFAVTLDASSDTGLRMWLTGDARVRMRDARLSELTLEGRYEQTAAGSTEPAGKFTLSRRVTSESEPRKGR